MRVIGERVPADDALATAPPLPARDAPLAAALVLGALRWHHRLEWQARQLLDKPLKAKHAAVGALLRIGLLQLQEMRIPDHAAVAATVDAVAELGFREMSGLANAVLRRFLRERAALDARMADVPTARFSHPAWLIDRIRTDWPDTAERVLDANNALPPMWLRVNLARTNREAYQAELAAKGFAAEPAAHAPAALRLAEPLPVESLPGFAAGLVSVQDAAAQLAAAHLRLAPGLRVLDACAAPGGKTCHILESQAGLAEVVALDRDRVRLGKVEENLCRLGLAARLVAADATELDAWWDGRPFDRVLLDAPCSATGVIRRHPDIKVLRRPEDVDRAVELQARLLQALWRTVAPGGRLVYATCSVLEHENAAQVLRFLSNNADAKLADAGPAVGVVGKRHMPGEADSDGFYYASVDKQEAA